MTVRNVPVIQDDLDKARMMLSVFKGNTAALWIPGVSARLRAAFIRTVNCLVCGARPDERCVSLSGRVTRNHVQRFETLLATTFALEREIVIAEEDDIHDHL